MKPALMIAIALVFGMVASTFAQDAGADRTRAPLHVRANQPHSTNDHVDRGREVFR
jgi:hypothetical protein